MCSAPLIASVLLALLGICAAHPVFQHHFNTIVNSSPCLKSCMDQATKDDVELSLLKTANISGYLLNLQSICTTIETAKACIAECGVSSNPFALESMTVICSDKSRAQVDLMSRCLSEQSNKIARHCKNRCGDYDAVNNKVHELTKSFNPEANDPSKVMEVMVKVNDACGVLKCSDRCTVKTLSEQCSPLEVGYPVGTAVKSLIENVLEAQRRDLEKMGLIDTMARSVPMQCNFMYMPEVMFDIVKDQQAVNAIAEARKMEQLKKQESQRSVVAETDQKEELNGALTQFQTHLLRKQMHLLDLQERNLMRENQKLEMELQLLERKRMQAINEDGTNKLV